MSRIFYCIIILSIWSCNDSSSPSNTLFSEIYDSSITFTNQLEYTEDFNPYLYRNFYNGGGVSCGDINNDGLIDIYFTGNQVDNKLYLNLGNWKFKDITSQAGVSCSNVWCTGANFVDINADGLLDIYVCKGGDPSGPKRYNELFINNGDLTFSEHANDFGLDIKGLSIQSAFLDFDKDGDLDCYILNNSTKPIGGGLDLKSGSREHNSSEGNKFMLNEGGVFRDVAKDIGIYNSEIGFGLGITISDFNNDQWPDIYISNDFFEKDYLYINQQNGTFKEESDSYFDALPLGAMGADAGDLDNDGFTDFVVTEMLPRKLNEKKTKALYESWKKYQLALKQGYAHQFPRNTLQLNQKGKHFSEIGRMAGIDATDWSWSCLIQDFDNNGSKEIFISNGIYKDLLDRDYLVFIADKDRVGSMIKQGGEVITRLIDSMPSRPLSNHMFSQTENLVYKDQSKNWGLEKKGFSNGCAYADLDNDGDLDLVINNVNALSSIYKNQSNRLMQNHFVAFDLKMPGDNPFAIGTKIIAHRGLEKYTTELFPSRGFQSSVPYRLNIGLGENPQALDSIIIQWPDGFIEKQIDLSIDSLYTLEYNSGIETLIHTSNNALEVTLDTLTRTERKNNFDQFDRDKLIYRMNPKNSPIISKLPNSQNTFVIGASKFNQSKVISIQSNELKSTQVLKGSLEKEVNDIIHLDFDNDGDLDLFLACGGSAYSKSSPSLNDMLFENRNGVYSNVSEKLNFSQSISTSAAIEIDWNNDGYQDILISDSKFHLPYGAKGTLHLLENKNGEGFESKPINGTSELGMITDFKLLDINNDNNKELIVIGEWMNVKLFELKENKLEPIKELLNFDSQIGIWSKIFVQDFDKNGLDDLFIANCGNNTTLDSSYSLILDDLDNNGRIDQILCKEENNKIYPVLDKDELSAVFPQINKKFLKYSAYANATMADIFGSQTMAKANKISLNTTESKLYLNSKNGLKEITLPPQIQFSSIRSLLFTDLNNDGNEDIILAGNHYQVKPQYGREDASRVWCLFLDKSTDSIKVNRIESLNINGEIIDMIPMDQGFLFTNSEEQIIRCRVQI